MSTESVQYEELIVDDTQSKLQRLCESQDRQITRLELEVDRLVERIRELESKRDYSLSIEPDPNMMTTTSTLPKGIQLKSQFRDGIENMLREKALQKKEEEKK